MKTKTDSKAHGVNPPPVFTKERRFRIEKLEERIAPKKGGNGTHKCATLNCTDSYGGSSY